MYNLLPIKLAMVKRGLNMEQLGELAHVSRPTVSRIIKGKSVLPSKLNAVLNVLGLSMADLFTSQDEEVQVEEPAAVAG